jgi:hypothetical protein
LFQGLSNQFQCGQKQKSIQANISYIQVTKHSISLIAFMHKQTNLGHLQAHRNVSRTQTLNTSAVITVSPSQQLINLTSSLIAIMNWLGEAATGGASTGYSDDEVLCGFLSPSRQMLG